MTAIGQAVRELRELNGWTQAELAAKLAIPQSTLSAKENGRVSIKPPERKRFAEAFGLSLEEFDEKWRASRIERTVGGPGIPVINRAPAGMVANYEEYSVDSGQGFEYLDRGDVGDELAFAVIVVGDSMEPALFEGDYLVLSPVKGVPKPKAKVVDGAVVFIRFTVESRRDGCMLARWHQQPDGTIVLSKDNKSHRPIVIRPDEVEQLAVAVEKRSKRI